MKPANPIINVARYPHDVTRNNHNKLALVLGLGLLVGSASLYSSNVSAQVSTVEQALPPTSMAHATLTREEAATLTPSLPPQPSLAVPSVPPSVQPDTTASATTPSASAPITSAIPPVQQPSSKSTLAPVTYVQANGALTTTPPASVTPPATVPSPVLASPPIAPPSVLSQNNASAPLAPSPKPALPLISAGAAPSSNLTVTSPAPVVQNSGAPTSMAHATLTQSELPPGTSVNSLVPLSKSYNSNSIPMNEMQVTPPASQPAYTSSVVAHTPTVSDTLTAPSLKPSPLPDVFAAPATKIGEQEAQQTENSIKGALLKETQASSSSQTEELVKQWEEKLEILEKENIALRDKLQINSTDKLSDIKVDTVNQIREDVLRSRVIELERQLDKMRMEEDPNNNSDATKTINPDATKTIQKAATPVPPPPPPGKSGGEPSMFGR